METREYICPVPLDHVAAFVLHDPAVKLINDLATSVVSARLCFRAVFLKEKRPVVCELAHNKSHFKLLNFNA